MAMRLSVITPTYNRAHTLSRCYHSLCAQTFADFEWIVVDDGSTDETGERVSAWQEQAAFPIRYVYQDNAGKPSGVNRGVALAEAAMLVILDSDDSLPAESFAQLLDAWASLSVEDQKRHWCVTGLCVDAESGDVVGDRFPQENQSVDGGSLLFAQRVRGEKWSLIRTDLLRQHLYPVAPGIKFVPESFVWNPLGQQYLARCINQVVRIYHQPTGTGEGHLSGRHTALNNAAGMALEAEQALSLFLVKWGYRAPGYFLRKAVQATRFGWRAKPPLEWRPQLGWLAKGLISLAAPLGMALYWRDSLWARRQRGEAAREWPR